MELCFAKFAGRRYPKDVVAFNTVANAVRHHITMNSRERFFDFVHRDLAEDMCEGIKRAVVDVDTGSTLNTAHKIELGEFIDGLFRKLEHEYENRFYDRHEAACHRGFSAITDYDVSILREQLRKDLKEVSAVIALMYAAVQDVPGPKQIPHFKQQLT